MTRVRKQARTALDARASSIAAVAGQTPRLGWLRAVREALGMSGADVARRMGVTQSRVARIERAEADGTLKLETLQRAADALGCRVVYALVPKDGTLEGMVQTQARAVAYARLSRAAHTMRLEDQASTVDESTLAELTAEAAERRDLWK